MPLTAVLDGRPVYVFDHDAPALARIASAVRSHHQSLRCQDCDHTMTVVMPTRRRWHFRHTLGAPAECRYVQANESEDHRDLKRRIYDMCRARGWDAEVEWHVPGTKRRADVWARDQLGRQFTFEVQLSKIADGTSYARSLDHLHAGLTPVWLIAGDLRSWAFPDGARRVRLQRHGEWVLTGLGHVAHERDLGWIPKGPDTPHARKARVFSLTMLLPLLDSPSPTPSSHRRTSRSALQPPLIPRPQLALPAPNPPVGEVRRWPTHPLAEWCRPKRLGRVDRARSERQKSERSVIIDRLRTLAGVLAVGSVGDSCRFQRMSDLPTPHWTHEHFAVALMEVWAHRHWLWEHGVPPVCGGCGLSLDGALIDSGVHIGCRAPQTR
ncbi:competence protein CoiA family protein [Nocardioides sp. NPDC006303]|uniref:competence protein CoiA n=1 Tax=Nocardioides sp. NPDC006303 TaxID=3156747 RepID=UPI00339E04D0